MKPTVARSRRGTFIPFLAVSVTAIFAMVALAIDLGMLTIGRTQCQNAADTGALVGARLLNNRPGVTDNDRTTAVAGVKHVVAQNKFFRTSFDSPPDAQIQVGQYNYNTTSQQFSPDFTKSVLGAGESWTAMRTTIRQNQPTFFAKVLGISSLPNGATATAVHRPRDVSLILDFSVSMRFGSIGQWPSGYGGSSGVVSGMLNPDPNYPQFGHYGRYTQYSTTNTLSSTNASSGTAGTRPNPLYQLQRFELPSGEVHAPNNFTVETPGGPPVVHDFRFDPRNRRTPATPQTSVAGQVDANGQGLWNAFHRWVQTTPTDTPSSALPLVDQTNLFKYVGQMRPPVLTEVDNTATGATSVVRTFNWTGYNAFDLDNQFGPTPAPDSFATQTASGAVAYVGDVYPGKNGLALPTTWDPTNTAGPAVTTAEMLGWGTVPIASGATGSGNPPSRASFVPSGTYNTANDWRDVRDATWERYGYDLTMTGTTGYVTSRGATWDPRWDRKVSVPWATDSGANGWVHSRTGNPTATFTPVLKTPSTGRISTFNGYSMGPGYWGKTFWMWPPDPRFGIRDPRTGDMLAWPDVQAPRGGTISSTSTSTTLAQSDPAFSTRSRAVGTSTWTTANPPIPMCDWRRRFFMPAGASETDPNTWFDPQVHDIAATLFRDRAGSNTNGGRGGDVLNTTGYLINYRAVLAWLKSGPQVLPTNLRAGRIVYYTSIPDHCDNAGTDADQRFWRDYIDFVLGFTGNAAYTPSQNLAGAEWIEWPEGVQITPRRPIAKYSPSGWNPNTPNPGFQPTDPMPAYNYTANPNRPRAHFWFGPISMMDFLACKQPRKMWWPGNVHEAQCWQLKAAIQSALEDIRINHPNDYCGMVYFASTGTYNTPRVVMGQQWTDLRNALYFNGPRGNNSTNLLPALRYTYPATYPSDTSTEHTPYNPNLSGFTGNGYLTGILPNANGGTDPISGFAMSFNILSTSPTKASQSPAGTHGGTGRLGAAKIVIYETDGVPNGTDGWTFTGNGTDTRYNQGGTNSTYPVPGLVDRLAANGVDINFPPFTGFASAPEAINQALAGVQRTVAPVTTSTSTPSGFSLPNAPCRVYPIGFGDLFDGYDGTNTWNGPAAATSGVKFLRRTGQIGNTLPIAGDPPLPLEYVINGSYQNRINNLRTLLERIMQSGVQVTLIE